MVCMKMTMDIPDELFREVKAKAAMEGKKLKDLVAESLRSSLSREANKETSQHAKFPILKTKGAGILSSDKDIAELEASEEANYYGRFMRH